MKFFNFKYITPFLIFGLHFNTCIGLALAKTGRFQARLRKDAIVIFKPNTLKQCDRKNQFYSKEEIIACLGDPIEINEYGECNILIYNNGYSWSIITITPLIGTFPLFFYPNGLEKRYFYIKENTLEYIIMDKSDVEYLFGYVTLSNHSVSNFGRTNGLNKDTTKTEPLPKTCKEST
ncbi:hypothetical protein CH381_27030 [Leptospira sp. mixed culture ATI2-C-A1]|nr:hypothetical protein CH381_27030 [Leptospira sp. mixed culture ATI2-C-A1]